MNCIDLTKELVKIESTNPGAYEIAVEKFIKKYLSELEKYGIKIYESEVCDGRNNLMAVFDSCEKKTENDENNDVVLICHMDTVVVGNDWEKEPFDAAEIDGKIYGRGATDMKSGLAVAIKTFEFFVKNFDKNQLKKTFKIIFTVDEEADMRGVEKVIKDKWVSKNSFVADLEPTNKMIQVAHKGRFWVKLNVKGKTAHASRPELGIDANICLSEILSQIYLQIKELPTDSELGNTTVTCGMMNGGYEPYVVPDYAYATLDFRLTPPTYNHDIIKIINNAILYTKKHVSDEVIITYEITGDREYVKRNENSRFLQMMKDTMKELQKEEKDDVYIPVVTSFSGYTDTAVIASRLKNGETFSYGPGDLAYAHKPNEYVKIEDIERCEKVYKRLLEKVLL